MAGRGAVVNDKWDGYVPTSNLFPNPAILRLSADLNWQPATEPLHRDIDYYRACGIGPGMAFANSLLRKDSSIGVVGLVPCAVGGTNISEWARGSQLYNQLIQRAHAAVEGGGTIKGLLWYQGESDTITREDAELYKRRSERFFDHVRSDLGLPTLPIVQVALASGAGPFIGRVREAQLGMWQVNLWTVDAKGLGLEPDRLHLTTPSQLLRRARVARRGGGVIRGILWFQGESDTVSIVDATMYKRRLANLFNNLRADLRSPLLPIIQVALASGQGPYVETVRKAQLGTKLGKVKCVDAKGLPLLQDKLHLSTPAQVQLGHMLADAFLKLEPMASLGNHVPSP
ncbi:SGNH hydrolase-type esterase domain-containing protein [Artemisia annua]|uniref:SGNH hydrolase-type esterase domain-containing protein n=1 Tax=Artemisia annua TaxID=35608 RepID=A0A2U1KA94_ARTAN|nr:SGNH hydrolase-type esterase domain-containing protein [Artemisia annua]